MYSASISTVALSHWLLCWQGSGKVKTLLVVTTVEGDRGAAPAKRPATQDLLCSAQH